MSAAELSLLEEFDRQAENMLRHGYPEAVGLSEGAFSNHILPLRDKAAGLPPTVMDIELGRIPFVIAPSSVLVPVTSVMPLVERSGKRGFIQMYPREAAEFTAIPGIATPDAPAYLVVDIDRGRETLNVTPNDALGIIRRQGRSPLTINEGVAMLAHYPQFLRKNNCYSLLGSRAADQRVPAIWISDGRPRLGWCWAGNPHKWLGSASCRERIGP